MIEANPAEAKAAPAPAPTPISVWWYAFGYFAAYVPYSALTKALSDGALPGQARRLPGPEMLPLSVFASVLGMVAFLGLSGWWRYAGRVRVAGLELPAPGKWTFLSGLASSAIIVTTTLAYTFPGVSIVLMMVLMRGGVLVIAPIVDFLSGRKVSPRSWAALGLSLIALGVGSQGARLAITFAAGANVALYLAGYLVRLRLMSLLGKGGSEEERRRFFVEEHMTSATVLLLALGALVFVGPPDFAAQLRAGFVSVPFEAAAITACVVLVGLFSEGTGVFGAMILLDPREATFSVPVNRASSILAGVLATALLWALAGSKPPHESELFGALLVTVAVVILSLPAKKKA